MRINLYPGICVTCGKTVDPGDGRWQAKPKRVEHSSCRKERIVAQNDRRSGLAALVSRLAAALEGLIKRHPHMGSCCGFIDGKHAITDCKCTPDLQEARAALDAVPDELRGGPNSCMSKAKDDEWSGAGTGEAFPTGRILNCRGGGC